MSSFLSSQGLLVPAIVSAVLAILPAWLWLRYLSRRVARDITSQIFVSAFSLGAIITFPIGTFVWYLRSPIHTALSFPIADIPWLGPLLNSFLWAALAEEVGKWAALVLLIRLFGMRRPLGTMVCGGALGLGFASFENLLYIAQQGLGSIVLRTVSAVPCHLFLGILMGAYLATARDKGGVLRSLWLPICLHGFYNFPLMMADLVTEPPAELLIMTAVVLMLIALWTRLLIRQYAYEHQRSQQWRDLIPAT